VTHSSARNLVVCPSCGESNVPGTETCDHCLSDLTKVGGRGLAPGEGPFAQRIGDVRVSKALTVSPNATVREAVAVMSDDPGGAVVVTDGTTILGIFTERDVLKKLAGRPGALDEPVAAYMSPDPVVLRDSDTMATALNKMGDGGFRHIPLTRDGRLVAMVTARDVLQWLMSRYFE
jgi:CBS domain-containing protein